jgi:acetyl/propionyl-CoA carboxylase alpha subunit
LNRHDSVTKLVIANRGEIARRILRAAREQHYQVAVVSTPEDRDGLVRSEADRVLEVRSFLDGEEIVRAARDWGARLLHPGYGFLSENADFAEQVEKAGIVFVGPTPENMRALGNKESAKALAKRCGIPTLTTLSSKEIGQLSAEALARELESRGLKPPYLVKASGGGGGRGMRVAETAAALPEAIRTGSEEALSTFGDASVFVERYLEAPRHIEVQIFGDGKGGGVFLGERECSMQRRHQKVVEEAPSVVVDRTLRESLAKAALALVAASRYRGAGTVEFLLDPEKDFETFYFLEVNTRLQVEHPVTEMVYDLDLVQAQLELAEGAWSSSLPKPDRLTVLEPGRVSLEARVLAEDPRNGFLPTPGPLVLYREPAGEGVRVDSGVAEGGRVNAHFDSMIAKVITVGDSRDEALERMDRALEQTIVHGLTTNLPFLQALVRHPDFRAGRGSTRWIEDNLEGLNASLLPRCLEERLRSHGFREKLSLAISGGAVDRPAIGQRFAAQGNRLARIGSGLEQPGLEVAAGGGPGQYILSGPGLTEALGSETPSAFRFSTALREVFSEIEQGEPVSVPFFASRPSRAEIAVTLFGETLHLVCPRHVAREGLEVDAGHREVRSPMAGKVLEIRLREGEEVEEGQVAFVIESMKMQLEVRSLATGTVSTIHVRPGEILSGPDLLATLE